MFISHKNSLKENQYRIVNQKDNRWVAYNGILVSNVCPHQGSLISTCNGDTSNRTCPYHGKTFNHKGVGINTFHSLETRALYDWRGLQFTVPISDNCLNDLSFDDYILREARVDRVKATQESILELFLDVEHIGHVHPGVYDKIGITENDIDNIDWYYYDWGNVQVVLSEHTVKAAWITVFPNTMIEYQNDSLFITVAGKTINGYTDVHVFKYKNPEKSDDLYKMNSDIWECAWEQDKNQAQLIVVPAPLDNLEKGQAQYRLWKNATD